MRRLGSGFVHTPSGMLVPAVDGAHDIGDATHTVRDLYLSGDMNGEFPTATSWGSTSDWTATVTNPTGRSWSAYYWRIGNQVFATITADFPGAMTAGSGQYIFSVPVAVDGTYHGASAAIGLWTCSLGGTVYGGTVRKSTNSACRLNISAGGALGAASPAAPVAGDTYWIQLSYYTSA